MKPLLLALVAMTAASQTPDIHEIMQRVAANQAKSEEARGQFVYAQKQTVRLGQTNGKLAREERREYRVMPAPRGVHRELISLAGRYRENGQEIVYTPPKMPTASGRASMKESSMGLAKG